MEEAAMTQSLIESSLWDRHARDWTCLQEARHRPLRRALLGALEPLAGVRLLDVGCGVGLLLREAADRGAWIAGVDAAAELLEVARWALPDADLRVATAEALPYDSGRFDVVTACNAVRYADDQPAALAELVRVVRPGGRVAIGQWADPSGCLTREMLSRLRPPADPGQPVPEALDDILGAAGLDRVDGSELDFPVTYPDLATAWSAMVARGLVGHAIHLAGRDAVYQVFLDVFGPAVRTDGSIRDENVFRYMVGRKPL
jgi:SAM-dependent methyltransferase